MSIKNTAGFIKAIAERVVEGGLQWLLDAASHPIFGLIIVLVMGILMAVNVITKFVGVSVLLGWAVLFLWIAHAKWIRNLSLLNRLIILIFIAIVLGGGWYSFGDWALGKYYQQQVIGKPTVEKSANPQTERPQQPTARGIEGEVAEKLPDKGVKKKEIPHQELTAKEKIGVEPKQTQQPDVALQFVYPKSPALVIINLSDSVASDIKWTVWLWNMDLPDRDDPLPIPVQRFDWIKKHRKGGPMNLFDTPLVSPLLKKGNRLFGSASVDCPSCMRGRTYIVYIIWGESGWVAEVEDKKDGYAFVPSKGLKAGREEYFKFLEAMAPADKRLAIKER